MKRILTSMLLLTTMITSSESARADVDLSFYQSQTVEWTECPATYLDPVDNQSALFKNSTITCATLQVPAIYDKPSALPNFGIAMMKMSPKTGATKGSLFINPGGPGESGIGELQWVPFPDAVAKSYDIIGFDPRGVGFSAPVAGKQIRCSTRLDFESYWKSYTYPKNAKQAKFNQTLGNKYYTDCVKNNPTWWTIATSSVVRDLEMMRSVLTPSRPLDFLGSSYGTTIAAEYITRFPGQVGHIILDSPTTNVPESDASQIANSKALEANVMRLVKNYAKYKNKSVKAIQKQMLGVKKLSEAGRLYGFAGMTTVNKKLNIHRSNVYLFERGIRAMTYYSNSEVQKYFNIGMDNLSGSSAYNGTFEAFAFSLDGYDLSTLGSATYNPATIVRDNSFEIMTIVNSMDLNAPDNRTDKQQRALDRKLAKASPFWTKLKANPHKYEWPGDGKWIDWTRLALKDPTIPNPPKRRPARTNTSGKGVLVVGSRYESTTPYSFAVKTAQELKSPLVTFNGTVHAPVAGFTYKCLNDIVVNYLVEDITPINGTQCSSK